MRAASRTSRKAKVIWSSREMSSLRTPATNVPVSLLMSLSCPTISIPRSRRSITSCPVSGVSWSVSVPIGWQNRRRGVYLASRRRFCLLGSVRQREIVLSEYGATAGEGAAARGASAVVALMLVQHTGGELVKYCNFRFGAGCCDRLGHPVHPAAGAKKVSSRSRMSAADCSAGWRFTFTRSTSKPA